ncbi:NAC domain-containing protein 41-like [Mangifera indica]|uniref:NAC domain-containing protein 41-like n=1 Tax=Mangifera indica TaxID=29780 RepID=UPI001CFA8BB4|nr:NAC domain-containing protein 41-like [Mangifera indica]
MQNPFSFSQETQFPQSPAFNFPHPAQHNSPPASYLMQRPPSFLPIQSFPSYFDSMASMQFPKNFTMIFPGLKFRPTDDELIGHYLHHKIFCGLPLYRYFNIKDCDLYGSQEPWEIWEFYKRNSGDDEDLYFFTVLKKKSSNGKRICRRIGSGSWMGEDAAKEIQTNGKVIGSKKRYRYENKGSEHDGGWIMHEYSLSGHDEYVLCRIRKNDRPAKKKGLEKKRKLNEVENFDENLGSNKIFKAQNYQEQVKSEATTPVNNNDVIEDNAANLSLLEVIFPGVTNDLDWADLGDLFVEEEQVQSSFRVVDDGRGSKFETATGSSVELKEKL